MSSFDVTYRITPREGERLDEKIENICIEQSVEIPKDIIPAQIKNKYVGEVSHTNPIDENSYQVIIKWPRENVGSEVHQLINILFGNISLKSGIQIIDIEWEALQYLLPGPAFGIDGIRRRFGIPDRPLSATAIKPLGSSVDELAEKTYNFAVGGIDIIKDDHNLTNQNTAPFKERIERCVEAVNRAAEKTGRKSYYFSNISGSAKTMQERITWAKNAGVDGIMVCPHISGLAELAEIRNLETDLPIIAHPSFAGSLFTNADHGFTPSILIGGLWRALGADMVIFPNVDGRFTFDETTCTKIAEYARSKNLPFKPAFPMPGGGIQRSNIDQWIRLYGSDTIFLIGGSLYQHPKGIRQASSELKRKLLSHGQK